MANNHSFTDERGIYYPNYGQIVVPNDTTKETILELLNCFVKIKHTVRGVGSYWTAWKNDVRVSTEDCGKLCWLRHKPMRSRGCGNREIYCINCAQNSRVSWANKYKIEGEVFSDYYSTRGLLVSKRGMVVVDDEPVRNINPYRQCKLGSLASLDLTHLGEVVDKCSYVEPDEEQNVIHLVLFRQHIVCIMREDLANAHVTSLPYPIQEYSMFDWGKRFFVICGCKLYKYKLGVGVKLLSEHTILSASGMARVRDEVCVVRQKRARS